MTGKAKEERTKKPCSCGDPKCKKGKRKRPISRMSKIEPIVNVRPSDDALIEFDADGKIVGDLSPAFRKKVDKALQGKTVKGLYSMALGLPSRTRRYVKKVWKLQKRHNYDWHLIYDEMAPIAVKILRDRIDLVTYTGIAFYREGNPDDEKLEKLSAAVAETDVILTVYSHFFLPGVSAKLTTQCVKLAAVGKKGYALGGIVDVVDYGRFDPAQRRKRRAQAENDMKTNGWKKPRREH